MPRLENGEEVNLEKYYDNLPRREFIRVAGGLAATSFGLSTLVKKTYGATPEGKIVVLTRDKSDRPARVKSVHPERYRRIKAYEHFNADLVSRKNPNIQGVGIRQRSSESVDLVMQIGVLSSAIKGRVSGRDSNGKPEPSGISGPPIDDIHPKDISVQADIPTNPKSLPGVKAGFSESPIKASVEDIPFEYTIAGDDAKPQGLNGGAALDDPNTSEPLDGTATLVGYDSTSGDPVLLTAEHITENEELEFSDYIIDDKLKESVAPYHTRWYGQDAITFNLENEGIPYDPLEIIDIPDVSGAGGYWTFEGVANETSTLGNNLSANLYGQTSGSVTDCEIDDTYRKAWQGLDYVYHTEEEVTDDGDSGGPVVDNSGYMFGHVWGENSSWSGSWSVVSAAEKTFDAVDFSLSN